MKAPRPTDGPLLGDLVEAYLTDVRRRGLSLATQSAYRKPLEFLERFLARRRIHEIVDVGENHVVAWALRVKSGRARRLIRPGDPYSPSTIHEYIAIVRRFFVWLVDSGVILTNPARGIHARDVALDPVGRLTVPSEAQLRAFLNELPREEPLDLRDVAVFELAYAAGLRIAEVRALDLGDVDLTEHLVHVRQGKGRKDRVVPFGRPAATALARWLDVGRTQLARDHGEHALFVTAVGRRLGVHTMYRRLGTLRRRGLLTFPLRIHDLRHASALHMLRHGADVRHVQELLGHASLCSTQIYTRLEPADLRAVHRKTHPRERGRNRS